MSEAVETQPHHIIDALFAVGLSCQYRIPWSGGGFKWT
jgi:hypothetical protein